MYAPPVDHPIVVDTVDADDDDDDSDEEDDDE